MRTRRRPVRPHIRRGGEQRPRDCAVFGAVSLLQSCAFHGNAGRRVWPVALPDTAGRGGPPCGIRRKAPARLATAVLVRGFVLGNDRSGNTPALVYVVTALLRPVPDFCAALTARAGTRTAAPSGRAHFASVVDVEGQLFPDLVCVSRTQVDLIRAAIKTKRYGLGRLAAVKIIDEKHLNLLCHGTSPSVDHIYF